MKETDLPTHGMLFAIFTIYIFGDSALLANPKKSPIWGDGGHM